MNNRLGLLICLVLVLGSIPFAAAASEAKPEVTGEDLEPVKRSKLESAYVKPGVDWSQYGKILVAQLDVSNVEVVQPPASASIQRQRQVEFVLNEVDRSLLQGLYAQKMQKRVFDDGGYTQANLPGPDTLMIRIAVVQIAPTAPKDDRESRGVNSTMYTEGPGSVSIKGILQDGESGELLAYFTDTRGGTPFWGRNDRFRNRRELGNIFDSWAKLFVKQLDETYGR